MSVLIIVFCLLFNLLGSVPRPSRPTYSRRGGNFVTLTWSQSYCDGGHEVNGFTISYKRSSYYSSYSYITVSNPAQRSYQIKGLSSSTTYQFRVQAMAKNGRTSSYSSTASISTLPNRTKINIISIAKLSSYIAIHCI